MLPSFAHHEIRIVHPTMVNDHGSEVPQYVYDPEDESTYEVVEGCIMEPLESQDADGDRAAVLHNWHLMAPPGTSLSSSDLVIFDGVKLGVHGEPQEWEGPTSLTDYLEAHLRTWIHGN